MALRTRDPRTKEELLDRMLSFDFDGDIRHLGAEPALIKRAGANRLTLTFPNTGRTYELSVHIPRDERAGETRSFAPVGGREAPFPSEEVEATLRAEGLDQTRKRPRRPRPPSSPEHRPNS